MKPKKSHSSSSSTSSPRLSDSKEKGISPANARSFKSQRHATTTSTIFSFSFHLDGILDSLDHREGSSTPDQMMKNTVAIGQPEQQTWCEKKQSAVCEEMKRMSRLPRNSTYVTHRLRVLNKIQQLMLLQRTASQQQELELLFGGLSL